MRLKKNNIVDLDLTGFFEIEDKIDFAVTNRVKVVDQKGDLVYAFEAGGVALTPAYLLFADETVKVFSEQMTVCPQNSNEWDEWLSMKGGVITGKELEDPDGNVYYRSWGSAERLKPQEGMMLFHREVEGHFIYLLFVVSDDSILILDGIDTKIKGVM